jgi:uncharacterized protein
VQALGYLEVGDIVGQHVNLKAFRGEREPTAAEVVNYADKRVLHDKVVSLEKRMDYIMERYSNTGRLGNRLEQMGREAGAIENKLFQVMPFSAAELADHLIPDDFKNELALFQKVNQDHLDTST